MTICKFGVIVTGLRGTVGGLTFSANKSGPYARAWSRGANPRSTLQSTHRANLSALAAQWRNIDPANQADWNTWAADPLQELENPLGEGYYISGFLWWVRMSRWLTAVGRDPIETAPLLTKPAAPTIAALQVSVGASDSIIGYADNTFAPLYDCTIQLCIGPSIGATAKPLKPLFLKGAQLPGGNVLFLTPELTTRFGALTIGMKAFAEVSRQNLEGYRSAPFAIPADIIA